MSRNPPSPPITHLSDGSDHLLENEKIGPRKVRIKSGAKNFIDDEKDYLAGAWPVCWAFWPRMGHGLFARPLEPVRKA